MIRVQRLDHLVLTVADIDRTCQFYESVLGMRREQFGEGRVALKFGDQKINLHQAGKEIEPKANRAETGTADLCLIADCRLEEIEQHLHSNKVAILEGPVPRTGALGPITSFYIRDPDLNLIEISFYPS